MANKTHHSAAASALLAVSLTGVAYGLKWDFEKELAFYGAYHQAPLNQAIHFVFIPNIWWTAVVGGCYFDLPGSPSLGGHRLSWGTAILALYSAYYCVLDPSGGGAAFSAVCALGYLLASRLVGAELSSTATKFGAAAKPSRAARPVWQWALSLHVLGWYMQIHPGHSLSEGVKPALVDSLAQALGVAPLFAFYEGIFFAGFQPELHARMQAGVAAQRLAMCAEQQNRFHFCSK